ncbi:MAG: hypothetical protein AAFX06_29095 [Planctomycetota bacterium]
MAHSASTRRNPYKTRFFNEFAELIETSGWQRAYDYIEELCSQTGDHGPAWEMRGLLASEVGESEQAVRSLENASLLVALEPVSSRTLALEYIRLGRRGLGIDLLHSLGMEDHIESALLRLLAQDLCRLGKPTLAVDCLASRLSFEREDAALWHDLSAAQTASGLAKERCLDSARRAIALAPSVTEFRVTASLLLIHLDRPDEAYHLVTELPAAAIRQIDCPCCLWRLICLFDCYNDRARARLCYDLLSA